MRSRAILLRLLLLVLVTAPAAACTDIVGTGSRSLEIMWPRDGATLYGYETLRARIRGEDIEDYEIYWYIDGGVERRMYDEWYDYDYPDHKAYEVDTFDWYWNGRGPYTIGFIAEDYRGRRIAHRTIRVYVE